MLPNEEDNSLDGGATYAGFQEDSLSDMSLGDEGTLSDKLGDQETVIDDSEVVDLESRYKVESTLGRGGMGEVILAVDTRLGRKVAIKRILGEAARSKTAVDRFLTEAKSIAAIGDHPNIVQIYDYGRAKDGPFIIIEYVDGINLQDRCREGALPLEEAVDMTCQLCDGLSRAHDQGIVHRDIKPANVLLTKNGVPKLTDFGLAKADATDHQMTVAGAVLGTPDFMPPEQRRDAAEVDARSDLWSLAATLYQMVTGRSPKIIRFRDVPDELEDILGKALEESKDDRFQTIKEFRDALKSSLTTDSASSKPIQVAGTLAEGQCKACGTVTGDLNRKFCRNPECGASLRVACLKCEVQIPVWDGICGECGANQPQLIQARRESLEELRAKAEQFLNELAFDEAISAADQVVAESHPDLADIQKWAADFLLKVEREKEQQLAAVEEHVKDARVHLDSFDYTAAIHTLEGIAKPLQSNEVKKLLATAIVGKEESASLVQAIRSSIKSKELGGLIPKVRRAQELCGAREDLKKLLAQLTERRDTKISRVREAFENGQIQRAAARADSLDPNDLEPGDKTILDKVGKASVLEKRIQGLIQNSKSDGVVDSQEAQTILDRVLELLEFCPEHQKMLALKEQCVRRGAQIVLGSLVLCQGCGAKVKRSRLAFHMNYKCPGRLTHSLGTPSNPRKKAEESAQGRSSKKSNVLINDDSIVNSIGMRFTRIPPGKFLMGSPHGDSSEEFQHIVEITQPFFIGTHQVTQSQYETVMGHNPSNFRGNQLPVSQLAWEDANRFCQALAKLPAERSAGVNYQLPTEAQWEYACRAGTTTVFNTGDVLTDEDALFCNGNAANTRPTVSVGTFRPNAWGLYDMHGNVWEWTADWFSAGYYHVSPKRDPKGPTEGMHHTLRGGSASVMNHECHSAARGEAVGDRPSSSRAQRYAYYGDFGMRVICVPRHTVLGISRAKLRRN